MVTSVKAVGFACDMERAGTVAATHAQLEALVGDGSPSESAPASVSEALLRAMTRVYSDEGEAECEASTSAPSLPGDEAQQFEFQDMLDETMRQFWARETEITHVRAWRVQSHCRHKTSPARAIGIAQNAVTDVDFTRHDLPIARIKRIMQQDVCDNPRVHPTLYATHQAAPNMHGIAALSRC